MPKLKALILASTFILAGSLIIYFQSYKDLGAILNFLIFILILVGWTLSFFIIFPKYTTQRFEKRIKKDKASLKKQKILSTVLCIFCGAIASTNFFVVTNLAENRVKKILKYDATSFTIAEVIQFSDRNSRGGARHYAIIEYNTEKKHVTQAIYDYGRRYSIGQKLKIKYSVEYPEMFAVIQILESPLGHS